jgi:hypothetical protein
MPNYKPGVVPDLTVPDETSPEFTARVYALGINYALDVPEAVSRWFDRSGPVPVLGLVDGVGIRVTLVPRGQGRHRAFLNAAMRESLGVGEGALVTGRLWLDAEPRDPELPNDVEAALAAAGVLEGFRSWPPSHQREYLVAIEDAKRPDTRARRIARTIGEVLGRGSAGRTGDASRYR